MHIAERPKWLMPARQHLFHSAFPLTLYSVVHDELCNSVQEEVVFPALLFQLFARRPFIACLIVL